MTYTIALLEISDAAHTEIASLLSRAGYDHCFRDDGSINMNGIGLTRAAAAGSASISIEPSQMKVTLTSADGELEISGADDFRIVLGAGTSLTLEIKDTAFTMRELKAAEAPKPQRKKPQLSIVKSVVEEKIDLGCLKDRGVGPIS